MLYGKFQGVTVEVQKLKAKGDFTKHVKNFRNLGVYENILELITVETLNI